MFNGSKVPLTQYDGLVTKLETVERDNSNLKSYVKKLEEKIDLLEKDSKSTSIELRNVPITSQENKQSLCSTIKKLGTVIGSSPPILDSEIRDIYRTKAEVIVVSFTTTSRKEDLVGRYKKYNKDQRQSKQPTLNSEALKIPGQNKTVYLSEALTSKTRRLFFHTRELVKNRKIAATWTSYGKVYVRREEDQPPVRVNDESDLENKILLNK